MTRRIIVFGSRDYDEYDEVYRQLDDAEWLLNAVSQVIVHGACPTGADALAARIANEGGRWTHEPHPADWAKHGRAAGPIRNQEMVDAGADMALGFILNESRGSLDMLARLRKARIETRVVFAYSERSR